MLVSNHKISFIIFAFCLHVIAYGSFFGLAHMMDGFGNYSLWFPAAGFRIALIFILGWRYGLLIALAEITAQGFIGDWATWSYDPVYIFIGSGSPSFVCAFVVYLIERFRLTSPKLENFASLIWFVAALVITPLMAAPVAAGIKVIGGRVPFADYPSSIMSYWVGDMIGMLMFAPLVLIGYRAYINKRWNEISPLLHVPFILEFITAVIFIWLTVEYAGGGPLSLRWLPFFVPIVWISLRHGFVAASLLILILNILVVQLASEITLAELLELQAILALINVIGLVLGGLTSIRKTEREYMRKQYQTLTQIDRNNTMGDMASQIVHEIAQPISATSLYAGTAIKMLEKGNLDEKSLRIAMSRVEAETSRTLELVRRMQKFARKGELNRAKTTVKELMSDISHMIDISAQEGGIEVKYNISEKPLSLNIDAIQIGQAILNLTRNSIEAMETVDIKDLTLSAGKRGNGHVYISVTDTGVGMPEHLHEGISDKADGMGIGLKIVEAIMLAHDGVIERTKNSTYLIFKN